MSSVTETSTSVLGKQGEMDPSGMRCKKKPRGHDGSEASRALGPRWERGHDGSEASRALGVAVVVENQLPDVVVSEGA